MYTYPLRFTKHAWSIPLTCVHECGETECRFQSQFHQGQNNELVMTISANPTYVNGTCSQYKCVERTYVHLASYSASAPCGDGGHLCAPDRIVIPDSTFRIHVQFPLRKPTIFQVNSPVSTGKGYTLRQCLYIIKRMYMYIYEEEERTATAKTYNLQRECTCVNIDLKDDIETRSQEGTSEDTCSICYTTLKDTPTNTFGCNHTFHTECIMSWVTQGSSYKCPLCRRQLYTCTTCNGTRIVHVNHTCVVLPREHRVDGRRNLTDGVFSIYNYDFKDLMLESMTYNRDQRLLHLDMSIL